MTLSEHQIENLMICGRFNFPASKCIIQLDIAKAQVSEFIQAFEDYSSELRQAYEKGKIKSEFDIMTALENRLTEGGEGADEAAKALNSMRRNQLVNEHLNEMFGL